MPLEVRQLTIKSTIEEGFPSRESDMGALTPQATARLKAEILAECRSLVQRLLDRRKER